MMGLPEGWVTRIPLDDGQGDLFAEILDPDFRFALTINEQLKALGNGVVPQQAYEALMRLTGQSEVAA